MVLESSQGIAQPVDRRVKSVTLLATTTRFNEPCIDIRCKISAQSKQVNGHAPLKCLTDQPHFRSKNQLQETISSVQTSSIKHNQVAKNVSVSNNIWAPIKQNCNRLV